MPLQKLPYGVPIGLKIRTTAKKHQNNNKIVENGSLRPQDGAGRVEKLWYIRFLMVWGLKIAILGCLRGLLIICCFLILLYFLTLCPYKMALSILFVVQDVPRITKVQTFSYCEIVLTSYRIERNFKKTFLFELWWAFPGHPSCWDPIRSSYSYRRMSNAVHKSVFLLLDSQYEPKIFNFSCQNLSKNSQILVFEFSPPQFYFFEFLDL